MKNQFSKGLTMGYTAASNISSGGVVLVGAMIGIAITDIATGETGDLAMEGVYAVSKDANAITQGAQLYWDESESNVTTTATDNTACGKAFAAADAGDDEVYIKINV